MYKILLKVFGLSSVVLIAGCSKSIDQDTYNEVYWDAVRSAGGQLVKELTEPLELDVNTLHPNSITENGNPDGEVNSSKFQSDDYEYYFSYECKDKFKLEMDDIEGERETIRGTNYSVKTLDSARWNDFNDCVADRFKNEPIKSEDLRIFLTEPNLIKFKDVPKIRTHIDKIKEDNVITLKEVVDTYVLLDQVDEHSFNNVNKTLLEQL